PHGLLPLNRRLAARRVARREYKPEVAALLLDVLGCQKDVPSPDLANLADSFCQFRRGAAYQRVSRRGGERCLDRSGDEVYSLPVRGRTSRQGMRNASF